MRAHYPNIFIYGDGKQGVIDFCAGIRFSTHCRYLLISEAEPVDTELYEFVSWARPDQVREAITADFSIFFDGCQIRFSGEDDYFSSSADTPDERSRYSEFADDLVQYLLTDSKKSLPPAEIMQDRFDLRVDVLFDFQGEANVLGAVLKDRYGVSHHVFDSAELSGCKFREGAPAGRFNQFMTLNINLHPRAECRTNIVYNKYGAHWNLYRAAGINLPLISIQNLLGRKIKTVKSVESRELIGAPGDDKVRLNLDYDTVYFDLDETLVWNRKPVKEVVAFLLDQKKKGKTLHLLTRHTGNVIHTLNRAGLDPHWFHDIRVVQPGELKSSYIDEKKSIFIDNEFPQRLDVITNCRIPVLDLDQIDFMADSTAGTDRISGILPACPKR